VLTQKEWVEGCLAYYRENDLTPGNPEDGDWDKAHYPLPKGMGDEWTYLLHEHHQVQGVLQSEEVGRCCFFAGAVIRYLNHHWCDDWFEVFELYEKWQQAHPSLNELWISLSNGCVATKGPLTNHMRNMGFDAAQKAVVPSDIADRMIVIGRRFGIWKRQSLDKPARLKVETAWAINLAIYNSYISSSDWGGQTITHVEPLAVFGDDGFGTDSSGAVWIKASCESMNAIPSRFVLTARLREMLGRWREALAW